MILTNLITMNTKTLIIVLGPTAIGKTSLSIQLAKHFNTEIISADSRQFYKELLIGAAPPNTEELKEVQHHFIQHLSVSEDYNVGKFEEDAINKIEKLNKLIKAEFFELQSSLKFSSNKETQIPLTGPLVSHPSWLNIQHSIKESKNYFHKLSRVLQNNYEILIEYNNKKNC